MSLDCMALCVWIRGYQLMPRVSDEVDILVTF